MSYKLGTSSSKKLMTCTFSLQKVVEIAISISDVDFSVVEGVRTEAQQRLNIKNGVSWTMNSKHLANANGKARAVDIYPWVNGRTSHDPEHYKRIARAMFMAAAREGVEIWWGGFWKGGEPFKDAPHWELK